LGRGHWISLLLVFLLFALPLWSSSSIPSSIAFQNGEDASSVLGQSNFTATIGGGNRSGLFGPEGITIDSKGDLWISDSENNRVLEFLPPFSSGENASLVLGQQNFSSYDCGAVTNFNLCDPQGIAFDSLGKLYVADNGNNRILEFKPPFTNGESASVSVGTMQNSTTQSSLNSPLGLALDSSNNLWVADEGNERVVEFKAPISNNEVASVVLGQTTFISNSSGTNQSTFNTPGYLAFDHSGNLWVADSANRRILEFSGPLNRGEHASLVIAQPNFTSSLTGPSQSILSSPAGITFDSSGNLWATDTFNGRVLEFRAPFLNGENASLVIGATGFNSSATLPSQSKLSGPEGLVFDSAGNLWVLDTAGNRVLQFIQSGTVAPATTFSATPSDTAPISQTTLTTTSYLTSTPLSSRASTSESTLSTSSSASNSASSLSPSYYAVIIFVLIACLFLAVPLLRKLSVDFDRAMALSYFEHYSYLPASPKIVLFIRHYRSTKVNHGQANHATR
jgi:sugar lactone lactonase YvrE